MIVNKSMYPLQSGFGVISKMQDKFATLQMQLGTGVKAQTLAEMGRDLPVSLSVRNRLANIEGFTANIETVSLRLSFLDNVMTRLDSMEGDARNSAIQGQYGTNNINMATLPSLSHARFDELVTLLNSDVAGRYLFGGAVTDKAPLPTTNVLMDGEGGKAGFKTVVSERKAADAGLDGRGRLQSAYTAPTGVVTLSEDGVHPFGFKLGTVSTTAPSTSVTVTQPTPGTLPLGDEISVTFAAPADQIAPGHTITLGLSLPDGETTQITLRAVTAAESTGSPDEFVIGADADATAANFKSALDDKLLDVGGAELAAASTFAAAKMFFNGPGEPVLRVQGNPATATALRLATDTDTVTWYKGQSPAIAADGLGRLDIAMASATSVTLTEASPYSANHGFQITGVSADTANIDTTYTAANPSAVSAAFTGIPAVGETVTVTLAKPDGTTTSVDLVAVNGKAGPGQFSIGLTAAETAANFSTGLKTVILGAATLAEGTARQTVTAQVDESTRVNYGIEANESGLLRLMRTMGAMSVETYPDADPASTDKFDAMARRQQSQLSESHNSERGSVEILTMELAVARKAADNATQRHTNYKTQLDNLLSDVETVSKEDVAMEILALQTRLQASYQTTSMVSQLSLVNFI